LIIKYLRMETIGIVWQANTYKLDHIGMNPSAESYLVLHRFGVSIVLMLCLFDSAVVQCCE